MQRLLVFDFDGVIADSEILAHLVLAEEVSALGHPTSLEDSYRLYMGKRWKDIIATIERETGSVLGGHFTARFEARLFDRFAADLQPISGVHGFIEAFRDVPRCIASSSSPARLAHCLTVLGPETEFGINVFSAASVPRGKPHPDIFLHAAAQMGAAPAHAIVIEDSASGVKAAKAAGMTPLGLTAASHLQPGHGDALRQAGAVAVADTFEALTGIVRDLLA